MKNFVHTGNKIDVVAAAVVASGGVVIAGSMIGVASTDAEIGETFALNLEGVYDLPKTSALAISQGDIVYWDNTAKVVNKTSGGNTKLGVATITVPNPSPRVNVRLNGAF